MKIRKRHVALLLVYVLLVSSIPIRIHAEEETAKEQLADEQQINHYQIYVSHLDGGTIQAVGGSTEVEEGGSISFVIVPDANAAIQDVLVDGASVGVVSTYTFQDVTENHSIEATFMVSNAIEVTAIEEIVGDAAQNGTFSPSTISDGVVGTPYSCKITYSPNDYDLIVGRSSVGDDLPSGLSNNSANDGSCTLSGTPQVAGVYPIVLRAFDTDYLPLDHENRTMTITDPVVWSNETPLKTHVGSTYSFTTVCNTAYFSGLKLTKNEFGDDSGLEVSISGNQLSIQGTAKKVGTYQCTVEVYGENQEAKKEEKTFSVTVNCKYKTIDSDNTVTALINTNIVQVSNQTIHNGNGINVYAGGSNIDTIAGLNQYLNSITVSSNGVVATSQFGDSLSLNRIVLSDSALATMNQNGKSLGVEESGNSDVIIDGIKSIVGGGENQEKNAIIVLVNVTIPIDGEVMYSPQIPVTSSGKTVGVTSGAAANLLSITGTNSDLILTSSTLQSGDVVVAVPITVNNEEALDLLVRFTGSALDSNGVQKVLIIDSRQDTG